MKSRMAQSEVVTDFLFLTFTKDKQNCKFLIINKLGNGNMEKLGFFKGFVQRAKKLP